jgi:hypothetical protein
MGKNRKCIHDSTELAEVCDTLRIFFHLENSKSSSRSAFAVGRGLPAFPRVLTTSDLDEAIKSRGLPASEARGVYFVDWLATESFNERFRAKFKTEPIMAPQNSYEAVMVLARAFKNNPEDLQSGVSTLNYTGATGLVDFRGSRAGNRAEATLMVVADGGIRLAK